MDKREIEFVPVVKGYTRKEFIDKYKDYCPSDLGIDMNMKKFQKIVCEKCWEITTENIRFEKEGE